MTQQHLDPERFGVTADLQTDVRAEFTKAEANFTDLYNGAGGGGGSAQPFPFFGTRPLVTQWSRPNIATFSTWLNQTPGGGLSAATAVDNSNGLPLVVSISTIDAIVNPCLTGVVKSIGAPPWTITVGMAGFSPVATGGLQANIGSGTVSPSGAWFYPIILYDGTKAIAFVWNAGGAIGINHFSDIVPQSGNVVNPSISIASGFPFPDYFGWFRISNDGTNLTYYISPDGLLFFEVFSESVSFLSTITQVGFGLDHYEIGSPPPSPYSAMASILWNWQETSP